jgi:hypothetical protein
MSLYPRVDLKKKKKGDSIWLFNRLPWKITMQLIGKPSISKGHRKTMANC